MTSSLPESARSQLVSRIGDNEVLRAFEVLVTGIEDMGSFEFTPNVAGPKKAVHLVDEGARYYAFIANRHWLLWYFRRPGLRDGLFRFDELASRFPDFQVSKLKEPRKAEGQIRIMTVARAREVVAFVSERISRTYR
ncbi:MAG: hypothetical protein R3D32_14910 [Nitratireductor sp.]